MDKPLTEEVVKALRTLADEIEETGLDKANWHFTKEVIQKKPGLGDEYKAYRMGPRYRLVLVCHNSGIAPAGMGEVSGWQEL